MAEDNKKKDNLTGLDQFSLDKIGGIGMSAIQPKTVDTKDVDKQIAALEKPTGGSVYDKMAARYRSQGEGAVLRTQKNLANLFSPTINLIQEREAAAQNRFTLLKDKLPEFDDSTIFGHQSGNPMPIVEEIKNISKITREDMRMLSRLNVNDERYDEIRKRIEKNQDAIVAFDAINEKLLEIRNSQDGREDDSQWSRGMDATTRKMWEDIYASNGQNIKIQDGKLVWTSTGVNVGYDISSDTKQDLLGTDSSLGIMHQIRNKYDYEGGMEDLKKNKEDVKTIQKKLLELYPKRNLGTTGDNSDGVDGNWGDLTQAAYSKYFRNKNKLEQKFYDKNLTNEEKKQFGIATRVGETRVIDLNEIGDGPTMIDNIGIKKDIDVQNTVQKLINDGVTVNTPGYESTVNAIIRTINSVGPKGVKSLIFDGFGAQQGDVLKSTNTDSFIKQIIQNNPKEFGIKNVENLTQEEIANAYDIMRSRDVTYSYSNESGESQTLQSQYLQWYRKQIDNRVQGGVKTTSGIGNGSSKTTSGNFKKDFSSFYDNWIQSANSDKDFTSSIKLPSISIGGKVHDKVRFVIKNTKDYDKFGLNTNKEKEKLFQIVLSKTGDINKKVLNLNIREAAIQLSDIYGITQEEALAFLEKSVKDVTAYHRGEDGSGLTPYEQKQKVKEEKENKAGKDYTETLQNTNVNFRVRSDIRLKENIKHIGFSNNNIPIYKFNYIDNEITHSGVMAQDLIKIGRSDAVTLNDDGYYSVNYNLIDVNFNTFK
tara:strand:- start:702 stop:2990 length:2289 start_codon:yes stop_codon:yes gene_type:complete